MPPTHPAASPDRFYYERQLQAVGTHRIAGIDEAGRGPLAGPVVAAAVVLPAAWVADGLPAELRDLNDSKQLTPRQRDRLFAALNARPEIQSAVAQISADQIDHLNILQATRQAMIDAWQTLRPAPEQALIDGLPLPQMPFPFQALVKGDTLSFSIAAASILAKVTRDRLMIDLDRAYPQYGFAQHKGYGTKAHLAALARLGPCPLHRRSFAPVQAWQLPLL